MKMSLPEFALKRPVTVMMLMITVLGFGVLTAVRIPIEFMPPMDLPFLGVWIPYPGATPEQVEKEIAILAEGEFQTLPNLKKIFTSSSMEGCFVSLRFEWGLDMNTALAEVRDRMERLRLVLPDDTDKIFIRHFSLESIPVMEIGLKSEGGYETFGENVDKILVPRLLRLEGVADVKVWGWEQRDISLDLDQQALSARNINLYELIMDLNVGNVDMGVGHLIDGEQRYQVRVESKLESIQDYQNLPIGDGVRLGEVARGNYREKEDNDRYSVDGKEPLYMVITKESEANTAATCKAIEQEMAEILDRPEMDGATQLVFFNQGDIISGALRGLLKASIYGGFMALIVLFLFLRRIAPTIIVALAIPGSILMAFVFLYAAGMSLNLITMMSLIIAVGMVVDNSIVVVENIYRYQRMDYSPYESARRGASEVALAIVAATLTTAAVFIPVMYIDGGQMATFMKHFSIPVVVALVASLILALTVIPLALSRMKPIVRTTNDKDVTPKRMSDMARLNPLHIVRSTYHRLLRFSVSHRLASFMALMALVALTVAVPMKQSGYQQMPQSDERSVHIGLEFDVNYTIDMAGEVFEDMEAALEPRKEELGIKHMFKRYDVRNGELTLFLLKDEDMDSILDPFPYTSEEVMDIIWYMLPEQAPGVTFTVSTEDMGNGVRGGGGGGGSGQKTVSVSLEGDEVDLLSGYAEQFKVAFEALPGITSTKMSTQRDEQEVQLKIDQDLAASVGLDPMQIAQTVAFAIRGTQVSKIKRGMKEIIVWAQFEEGDRQSIANLNNITLTGSTGAQVTLNQLVTQTKASTPMQIMRRNGKNFIAITGNTAETDLQGIRKDLYELIDSFSLPLGYSIGLGDELQNLDEEQQSFFSILIMAILLIFIVMSALFESCLLPLSILTTVPLAFLGVSWIMFLTGKPMDTVAFIGCILMVGVVVNNGIVIVDHINQLRKDGLARNAAIVQAGQDRLRPVLMTAITTILGAIPLAIGGRIGEPAAVSLGMSMIGGLTAGTFLTLLVVPLFYSLVDDIQEWVKRFLGEIALLKNKTIAEVHSDD